MLEEKAIWWEEKNLWILPDHYGDTYTYDITTGVIYKQEWCYTIDGDSYLRTITVNEENLPYRTKKALKELLA